MAEAKLAAHAPNLRVALPTRPAVGRHLVPDAPCSGDEHRGDGQQTGAHEQSGKDVEKITHQELPSSGDTMARRHSTNSITLEPAASRRQFLSTSASVSRII